MRDELEQKPPEPAEDEEIPRLPRGRGFKIPTQQLMSLLMLIVALIALLALRGSCSQGVANFFETFAPPPDGGARVVPPPPSPGTP